MSSEPRPTLNDSIRMPAAMIPSWRTHVAIDRKVERNLLFKTWGGLGDQICAEPTLRFVLKSFKDCDVSLASEHPKLFSHLKFKKTFDLKESQPLYDRYFVFETIVSPDHLTWEFMSHCLVNCVDFPALCAIRSQLPVADREIILEPTIDNVSLEALAKEPLVLLHAGRHWPSKTFPKEWWDRVIRRLLIDGIRPVLIGADTDDNRGTVDVESEGCLDLRNVLTINESIWLCQRASVLLTNDSSPLHMAASRNSKDDSTGKTWIGYIATCKHPDYITHFRKNLSGKIEWQWREENLGLGGMWDLIDHCPNKSSEITVDKINEETLLSWLPEPSAVSGWVTSKLGDA